MAIERDIPDDRLRPILLPVPPAVEVAQLLAVGTVELTAAEVPLRDLQAFYQQILGLRYDGLDGERHKFRHERRLVLLDPSRAPGNLGLAIRAFGEALRLLHERRFVCHVLHVDGGLSRVAAVRDPAGNRVVLAETRPL